MQDKLKEEKQKVTLYLPQEVHRQLKIKAAVDSVTMTDIAQKAIVFYLANQEFVEQHEEGYGNTHRVYNCPECSTQVVMRDGEMVGLQRGSGILLEESLSIENSQSVNLDSQGEGELVPCQV